MAGTDMARTGTPGTNTALSGSATGVDTAAEAGPEPGRSRAGKPSRAAAAGLWLYRHYRLVMSPERLRMRRTVRNWIRSCHPGSRILDVGGGTSMLRRVVEREVPGALYISSDIAPTNSSTVALDALAVPMRDGTLDAVLALEVLEHVPDPERMIREAARVLTPGGMLVLTTPFMYGLHNFRDYYRYTPLGLRTLLEPAGLTLEMTVLRGGTFVSATGLVKNLLRDRIVGKPEDWRARSRRKKALWVVATLVLTPWTLVTWVALGLDRLIDRNSASPPGYFFLCRKHDTPPLPAHGSNPEE
jgi:SAM-dependent methyltransferase